MDRSLFRLPRPFHTSFKLLLILALCIPTFIALPGLPDMVETALAAPPLSSCKAQIFNGQYPDANGTIHPERRQPYEATLDVPPSLTVQNNIVRLTTGRVTLPQLKTALDSFATSTYTQSEQIDQTRNLLQQSGPNTWLLRGNLEIERSAALSVVGTSGNPMRLRIESTAAITPSYTIFTRGYLRFENAELTSWDTATNTNDTNYRDGRAYVVAYEGGRMDFYKSEVSYLGWRDGEGSGLAWRKCFNDADQRTGATGDIHDSVIHHNFFGMYSYEAFAIWAKNSIVRDSVYYGFDPHDYSDFFIFEDNQVYNNGKHGIIFSRWCDFNIIRNNIVYDNKPKPGATNTIAHGIFLDRRSTYNLIFGNTVYNSMDGIAIFQSQYNIIRDNEVRDSLTGIRINATPVSPTNGIPDRTEDQQSLHNQIYNNVIKNNKNYGIYLYNRADNNVIRDNTITGNGRRDSEPGMAFGSGIHIKTGGNEISKNLLQGNGHGISLMQVDASPDPVGGGEDDTPTNPGAQPNVEPGLPTGSLNQLKENTVRDSKGRGLRLVGANNNTILSNEVSGSGDEGMYADGSNNNRFETNYIHHNGLPDGSVNEDGIPDVGNYGVNIKGTGAKDNFLTKNRITANGRAAIKLGTGTNNDIDKPLVETIQPTQISGRATPGATVEVFRDPLSGCGLSRCGDEAAEYVGSAIANSSGNWVLTVATAGGFAYAATQTVNKNTSELSRTELAPTVTVGLGRKQEQTIYVDGTGAELNLYQIKAGLTTYADAVGKPEYKNLITDDGVVDGKRTWTLHASLFISPTVSLFVHGGTSTPSAQRVDWLRLFSDPGPLPTPNPADPNHPIYDATKFATIKTYSGNLYFVDTRVTSWDRSAKKLDENIKDGRSFILAKYDSEMSIIRSDMSYLGYADGEAYGLSWRDVNSASDPPEAPRRTRVTGQVLDSIVSHNYYGIYTFQARDMLFRGNKFFSNVQYGFDPHDFTHDVIVENNEAYDNGSHGFIISRGCSNFVFRNNISRDNKVRAGSKNPSAHAFMLDPGADEEKAGVPQVPSVYNIIENNIAFGNDGYAIRIYGSDDNIIRNNLFYNNRAGITIEKGSTRNVIIGNEIRDSRGETVTDPVSGESYVKGGYGIYTLQGADANTIKDNKVSNNVNTGIYLKTGANLVTGNIVFNNKGDGIGTLQETKNDAPVEEPSISAAIDAALTPGAYIDDQQVDDWSIAAITAPKANTIISNTLQLNTGRGISLKGASNTQIEQNLIERNQQDGIYIANGSTQSLLRFNQIYDNTLYGIKVNGSDVQNNRMTQNSIARNLSGGIAVTGGANNGLAIPQMEVTSIDLSRVQSNVAVGSWMIRGTTIPNGLVEVYSDSAQQAMVYLGATRADDKGIFEFISNGQPWGMRITATVTDGSNNTSALSKIAKNRLIPWLTSEHTVFLPFVAN